MKRFQLSILDLVPVSAASTSRQALQDTLALARFAEEIGYHRYWLAEHHNMPSIASSSPEVLIGHVAQVTSRLRVGSGGIMLPNHSPLKVAETFRTLEAFHPGRIDLGLGRAPGTSMKTALALRGAEKKLGADQFSEEFSELLGFLHDRFLEEDLESDHPFAGIQAMPAGVNPPEIWILGSSDWGAQFAARYGLRFAFAHHFSAFPTREVMELYHETFRPSRLLEQPHAMLTVNAVCARTDSEAEDLALPHNLAFDRFKRTGRFAPLLSVAEAQAEVPDPRERERLRNSRSFVGSPDGVAQSLSRFAEEVRAEEIMVTTLVPDTKTRRQSYALLMEKLGQPIPLNPL